MATTDDPALRLVAIAGQVHAHASRTLVGHVPRHGSQVARMQRRLRPA